MVIYWQGCQYNEKIKTVGVAKWKKIKDVENNGKYNGYPLEHNN